MRPFLPPPIPAGVLLLASTLLLASCGVEEVLLEPFRGETPHERYLEALELAGLAGTALARQWRAAADEAVERPVRASLPKEEEGSFGPEEPLALGYRVELRRGQRFRVVLEVDPDDPNEPLQVFLELFRLRGSEDDPHLLTVAWTDAHERVLEYEARATAPHLLRVQPELLAGGAYRLRIETGPSLSFPVEGRDTDAIRSLFGAPREGGRREHHGVDIFAPRGTPVLAASAGTVRRAGTNRLGGNVVWIRDEERGMSQYYAHLDTQLVASGARVNPGDTVGLVGNTGNARTTPPHLHFGLYVRGEGPVDPWDFLYDAGERPAPLAVDRSLFREIRTVTDVEAPVRESASPRSPSLARVRAGDSLRVLGGSGGFLRVRLRDGTHGYLSPHALQAASDAVAGSGAPPAHRGDPSATAGSRDR